MRMARPLRSPSFSRRRLRLHGYGEFAMERIRWNILLFAATVVLCTFARCSNGDQSIVFASTHSQIAHSLSSSVRCVPHRVFDTAAADGEEGREHEAREALLRLVRFDQDPDLDLHTLDVALNEEPPSGTVHDTPPARLQWLKRAKLPPVDVLMISRSHSLHELESAMTKRDRDNSQLARSQAAARRRAAKAESKIDAPLPEDDVAVPSLHGHRLPVTAASLLQLRSKRRHIAHAHVRRRASISRVRQSHPSPSIRSDGLETDTFTEKAHIIGTGSDLLNDVDPHYHGLSVSKSAWSRLPPRPRPRTREGEDEGSLGTRTGPCCDGHVCPFVHGVCCMGTAACCPEGSRCIPPPPFSGEFLQCRLVQQMRTMPMQTSTSTRGDGSESAGADVTHRYQFMSKPAMGGTGHGAYVAGPMATAPSAAGSPLLSSWRETLLRSFAADATAWRGPSQPSSSSSAAIARDPLTGATAGLLQLDSASHVTVSAGSGSQRPAVLDKSPEQRTRVTINVNMDPATSKLSVQSVDGTYSGEEDFMKDEWRDIVRQDMVKIEPLKRPYCMGETATGLLRTMLTPLSCANFSAAANSFGSWALASSAADPQTLAASTPVPGDVAASPPTKLLDVFGTHMDTSATDCTIRNTVFGAAGNADA